MQIFPALCTTKTFQKSDGNCACGFFLETTVTWRQAIDTCAARGARLPEVKSDQENTDLFTLKVSIHFFSLG